MKKSRIELKDTPTDVMVKLCEGNPGAMNVIVNLFGKIKQSPDNPLGALATILLLDTYGIYGSDIYVLYNDICERSLPKTVAVITACQLGLFDSKTLANACSRQDYSGRDIVPVEDLYNKVIKERPLLIKALEKASDSSQ